MIETGNVDRKMIRSVYEYIINFFPYSSLSKLCRVNHSFCEKFLVRKFYRNIHDQRMQTIYDVSNYFCYRNKYSIAKILSIHNKDKMQKKYQIFDYLMLIKRRKLIAYLSQYFLDASYLFKCAIAIGEIEFCQELIKRNTGYINVYWIYDLDSFKFCLQHRQIKIKLTKPIFSCKNKNLISLDFWFLRIPDYSNLNGFM